MRNGGAVQKLKMHTPDITDENIEKLIILFPNCITETKLKNGRVVQAIDFDKLRQELSKFPIVDGLQERYQLNWPGKTQSVILSNIPTLNTLRPCREESVNFNDTKNLFIEGDNLDALKLLHSSYLNKIKMIYIDPPYNTGNDFIYKDTFQESRETYTQLSSQIDESGNQMVPNLESQGRFHSNWLSMIYSRLRLSRNLLSDDGVICISIDDHEVHNLRKICDEIFGSQNFIAQLVWNSEGHTDNQYDVKINHEYILLYGKSEKAILNPVVDPNTRKDSNLWKGFAENSITKNGNANPPSEITLPIGFPCIAETLELPENSPPTEFYSAIEKNGYITREMTKQFNVTFPIRKDNLLITESKLAKPCRVYSGWANIEKLRLFIKGGCEPIDEGNGNVLSFYLSDRGVIYYRRVRENAKNIVSVLRNMGTTEQMRSELERMNIPFQYPKPKELIIYLLRLGTEKNSIVLDFFSGSATTAHGVMALNAEDGGKRRYIMVQLPEICNKKSEAFKLGYKSIAEIGKERIRRCGENLKKEYSNNEASKDLDIGFRVLKIESSNMKDVYYQPKLAVQSSLFTQIDNIKEDRSTEDLLFQILIDWGIDLALPIIQRILCGKTVYFIEQENLDLLVACFDMQITEELVKEIAKYSPVRVVFRNTGFDTDSLKINVEQIFNHISPDTEIKVL